MTFTDRSTSQDSLVTPQFLHREAAVHVEEIAKHHRQAVLLHDAGDARQEKTHAGIAYKHIAKLLEVSGRALNIQLQHPACTTEFVDLSSVEQKAGET